MQVSAKEAAQWVVIGAAGIGLLLTGAFLDRMFAASSSEAQIVAPLDGVAELAEWPTLIASGHRMGPDAAPVVILEFGDFRCPACRRFQETIDAIRTEFPTQVAFVYRHWPLGGHPAAIAAANASECAAEQGRFADYAALLFEQQPAIGTKSFVQFAVESSVRDTAKFRECLSAGSTQGTVDADASAAVGIGSKGTPAVLINGRVLPVTPGRAELAAYVRRELREK